MKYYQKCKYYDLDNHGLNEGFAAVFLLSGIAAVFLSIITIPFCLYLILEGINNSNNYHNLPRGFGLLCLQFVLVLVMKFINDNCDNKNRISVD